MAHILVVEDNQTMREGILQTLEIMGHEVFGAENGKEGLSYFSVAHPDLVLTDLKMDGIDGMEVLEQIKTEHARHPTVVIMITAFGTIDLAVQAMQKGAFDFISKPFSPDLLRIKVKKALDVIQTQAENTYLREQQMKSVHDDFFGQSKAMRQIQDQLKKVAPSNASVVIQGETGTGKDVLARMIHQMSPRAHKPFVKVDCSALNENLLESELFGHERGAFTGAHQRKMGRFELADKGTLFLDEIGEVPPSVQVKLLRILQDRTFERVGGTKSIHVDVRLISATHQDLKSQVQEGQFRQDLFYRLSTVPFHIPPLRKRLKDLPQLVDLFLKRQSEKAKQNFKLTPEALLILTQYPWPGNIRELENAIERIVLLSNNDIINDEDIPIELQQQAMVECQPSTSPLTMGEALANLEKKMILEALQKSNGNKSKAAQQLGVKISTLYYKFEKYGLD